MVGATTAALLTRSGFSVALVEGRPPEDFAADSEVGLRVSAFSPGSAAVLTEAGAWSLIERHRHCHYRHMRVEDRMDDTALEFEAGEFGLARLGTIVENNLVQWALWQALQTMAGLKLFSPASVREFEFGQGNPRVRLDDGTVITSRLLVGADGARSQVRNALGITQDHWAYGQQGLVGVVETEAPNPGLAWQRFLDGGPIAFLPLADGRSSIVWSQPEGESRRLLNLDAGEFLEELESAVAGAAGHFPGKLVSVGERAAFPLSMRLSAQYYSEQAVLVGDAAHVIHPLAGQGVNLGLMDAAALAEILVEARHGGRDHASASVLRQYSRWRRSEAELMAFGIHGIRGLFMPPGLALLRRFGLGMVSRSWMLREAFIRRATGINPGAPELARGTELRTLIHHRT